ncbi:hypothetical protein [Alkalihalobacillus sp. 1P02AB]|uniref:hypothetical protein n=1 Tax=Alkalihalobacillus sp. 1P02AB TaxID=3132260 RepID=UPI0039A67DA2
MKIKVKIKHVAFSLFVLALIPIVAFVIIPQVKLFQFERAVSTGAEVGSEQLVELLESSITKTQKRSLIDDYILARFFENNYDVMIGPSFSYSNDSPFYFSQSEMERILEQYVKKGNIGSEWVQATKELASYYADEEEFDKAEGATTVSGRLIRSDGQALENIEVYLREQSMVNQSVSHSEKPMRTNEKGEFVFKGVEEGNYQLFIGFRFEHLDGWTWAVDADDWITVTDSHSVEYDVVLTPLIDLQHPINDVVITDQEVLFEWEEVEGAAYYQLSFGYQTDNGSLLSGRMERFVDNKALIPVEELYSYQLGIVFNPIEEREIVRYHDLPFEVDKDIETQSLLGLANPNQRLLWSVDAYDQHNRRISTSGGLGVNTNTAGFFYLQERELTEADRLLLEGEIAQAYRLYEQQYEQTEDFYSLNMLIKTLVAFDEMDRSYFYMEELTRKFSDDEYLPLLLGHYYSEQNWELYEEINERFKVHNGGELDSYMLTEHAQYLLVNGKYDEALAVMYEVMDGDRTHVDVGLLLALELYLGANIDEVVELANRYLVRASGYQPVNWGVMINDLSENQIELNTIVEKLEFLFAGEKNELENWMETIEEPALQTFIQHLQQEYVFE